MKFLDFLPNYKRKIGAVFLAASFIFNLLFKIEIDAQSLTETFNEIMNQSEVIASAALIIYGQIMAVYRKHSK